MKHIFFLISILISATLFSQEQKDTATYAFPIGSKFTLELIQTSDGNFKYQVLSMEPIQYSVDFD